MHQIYEDEGSFNFIYQIPQIIYSSLISGIIDIIIKYLSLSEKNIIEIKNQKSKEEVTTKKKEIFRILKIKFALFFIISFLLLLFFMYYIICFCGVYINTQIHLIKDTSIHISSAENISFFISSFRLGSFLEPVKRDVLAIEVSGLIISLLYSILFIFE